MKSQKEILSTYTGTGNEISNGFGGKKSHNAKQESPELKPHSHIKVLMYHRVVDDKALSDQSEFCIHVDEFQRQMQVLSQLGFTPITFHDIKLYSNGEIQLPRKPVIITFDDGFMDIYSFAYPILKEYGMRAVVFVLGDRGIRSNVWDQNNPGVPTARLMENHHIKELHEKDFEIGAHSLIHSDLRNIPEEDALQEIKSSKMILESLLGTSIHTFAYPFGSVNAKIKKFTIESGYQYGCGAYTGPAKFGDDMFEIRRIVIQNKTTIPGFVIRLVTPYQFMEWFWWKAKIVRREYAENFIKRNSE